MDSLKVALISEEYPPFMFGGIGSACFDFANALSRKGVQTTVFCGKAKTASVEKVNSYLEIVRLPCLEAPPRFVWFQLQNLKLFSERLRAFSVLHIFNPQAGAVVAYLKEELHKPLVTSVHGFHLTALKLSLSSPCANWTFKDIGYQIAGYPLQAFVHDVCLRNSDRVAVCNYSTVQEMKNLYRDLDFTKVSVIYNGINFSEIENMKPKGNSNDSGAILYCGRLYWAKGVTFFIDALAKLKDKTPNFRAEIFGDGPLRDKLGVQIKNLQLTRNVTVRGFVPRKQLFGEIQKASMVVLPSLYEAQPVAVLEAMACSKPVVAFNLPFASEIIKDGHNGLLARPGDVNDLSNKINLLVEDGELRTRLGKNAFEYVKSNHNWDTLVKKYLDIYREIS